MRSRGQLRWQSCTLRSRAEGKAKVWQDEKLAPDRDQPDAEDGPSVLLWEAAVAMAGTRSATCGDDELQQVSALKLADGRRQHRRVDVIPSPARREFAKTEHGSSYKMPKHVKVA